MKKKKSYTSSDIQVLSDIEHVRKRTNIYLGNMNPMGYDIPLFLNEKFAIKQVEFIPAVYKAVGEILDNVIDEFAQIDQKNKTLTIDCSPKDGQYTIADNGRGVPIDMHESGKHTPEVVFGSLRSGRNFTNEKEVGVIGANGVGASCVVATSTEFKVTIYRDNQRYIQTFENGGQKVSKPRTTDISSDRTGTEVSFSLDPEVFKSVALPESLMHNRAMEIAFTNPGVQVNYNGEKYRFKNGLKDIVKTISENYYCFESPTMEIYVLPEAGDSLDERMFTWVNSSLLFDGGLCNTQFLNAFIDRAITHLQRDAAREKCEVTKNDVRQSLLVLASIKISNPEYDAQSKTRLTGPNLRKEMGDLVEQQWPSFVRKHKEWLATVLSRAIDRHNSDANKKAIKEHQKTLNRKIAKLVDVSTKVKDRSTCQLLITEGDSAKSQITDVRDPLTTAAFPLVGKVNNIYGASPAELLKMGKLTDLLAAIGLVPGKRAVRSELRYGKIVIATDSDVDGGDIFTLLVNVFYNFWPELMDPRYPAVIHRLVAPNVVASKGKQRIHFTTRAEYEKQKEKYRGWTIEYMKGLGGLTTEDWEMILSGKTNTLIPVVNDSDMKGTIELLFGPDADKRKNWLMVD